MYTVLLSREYKKSLKKITRSGRYDILDIEDVVAVIASGAKLARKYQDHILSGKMFPYRECHIKADLLLVYQIKKDKLVLLLINIGNHSNLF